MQSPQLAFVNRSFATLSFAIFLAIPAMTLSAIAQKIPTIRVLAPEAVGYRLEQCGNGGRSVPQVQDPCNVNNDWVTGNVNNAKAHYREGDSVPYRLDITGLAPGVPTYVTFGWDTTKGGKHAIDYITSYDKTENASNPNGPSQAIPCAGLNPVICPPANILGDGEFAIPPDPNYSGAVPAPNFPQESANQKIKIWGGTITGLARPVACGDDSAPIPDNVNPYRLCGTYAGDSATGITVLFTPTGSEVVLAWGGHIAKRLDWGVANGATSISGAPFHTGMITGGSRDVQMALNAVLFPGAVQIIKQVNTISPVGTSATFQFGFTSSANSGLSSFFLVDDDLGPGTDTVAAPITTFFVAGDLTTEITVTENNYATAPHPFVLMDLGCQDQNGGLGTTPDSTPQPGAAGPTDLANRKVTVRVQEGEIVTCTFTNTESLSPSAAPATISGRALDSFGRGIGGARITAMDAQTGELSSAITNPFGFYTVVGTEVDRFYVMTISHKRFTFADDTRSFTLHDNLVGVDFVANP